MYLQYLQFGNFVVIDLQLEISNPNQYLGLKKGLTCSWIQSLWLVRFPLQNLFNSQYHIMCPPAWLTEYWQLCFIPSSDQFAMLSTEQRSEVRKRSAKQTDCWLSAGRGTRCLCNINGYTKSMPQWTQDLKTYNFTKSLKIHVSENGKEAPKKKKH